MLYEGCTLFSARDGDLYRRLYDAGRTEISDACLISRVAWNAGFNYQKFQVGELLSLASDGGVFTTPHITWPVGHIANKNLKDLIDAVWPVFRQRDWPLRLMYVDEMDLPLLEQLPGYQAKISFSPDFDDYLYDAESLRQLSGKALHGQRNQLNRFFRTYPDYVYQPLHSDDAEEALQLVQTWCEERNLDCQDLCLSDYRAIRQAFVDYDQLDIHGGTIRIGKKLVAFALGSLIRGDTAVIHFEKAAGDYVGLYAAINKLVVDYAFPDVRYVNREEDMGIEGLRRAKASYGPIRMIHKFEAILSRPGE